MSKIYLFIICPPFQGSTILTKLLDSSPNVSSFIGKSYCGEGCHLYKKVTNNHYANTDIKDISMDIVKREYDKKWDLSKPILMEKIAYPSYAKKFEEYFSTFGRVYFILSIRNLYTCRWLDFKNKSWFYFAKNQIENINTLNNYLLTSYEQLCKNKAFLIKKIITFLPELKIIKDVIYTTFKNTKRNKREHKKGRVIDTQYINRKVNLVKKNNFIQSKSNEERLDMLRVLDFFSYELV